MGPITYSLCQKPVIGLAMWITSLCVFPPLINDEPFPINKENTSITIPFEVPVDKKYSLEMNFKFPSNEAYNLDKIVGTRYNQYCYNQTKYEDIPEFERAGLGQPIIFKIVVREEENDSIIFDKTIESLCTTSNGKDYRKTRTITRIPLIRGNYIINIISINKQNNLDNVKTSVSLKAGRSK